jgi:prepilin-type N-terminal cleavage/methylation domain-containing protein
MPYACHRLRGAGFTLIELLAVIAVFLLLLTLLLPSFRHVRRRVDLVLCTNNLRQLYSLCFNYASEHGGELPQGLSENPQMFNLRFAKFRSLDAFMKRNGYPPELWYCPGVPKSIADPARWDDPSIPGTPEEFPIGYFYTGNVTDTALWKFKVRPPRTLYEFLDSKTPFLWDVCKAWRPSPPLAKDVTAWWIFPHYGLDAPAWCQFMMPGGHVLRRRMDELEHRFSYIHPGEVYW